MAAESREAAKTREELTATGGKAAAASLGQRGQNGNAVAATPVTSDPTRTFPWARSMAGKRSDGSTAYSQEGPTEHVRLSLPRERHPTQIPPPAPRALAGSPLDPSQFPTPPPGKPEPLEQAALASSMIRRRSSDPRVEGAPSTRPDHISPRSLRGITPPIRAAEAPERGPVDRCEAAIEELWRAGPGDEGPAIERLLSVGTAALPRIQRGFPGVLWFEPDRRRVRYPSGRHVSGLAAALVAFGPDAVEPLLALLRSEQPLVRMAAALTAVELPSPALVEPMSKLLVDPDPRVQEAARYPFRVLTTLAEGRLYVNRLYDAIQRHDSPHYWRTRAVQVFGALREATALDDLIEQLGSPDDDVAAAAETALLLLTGWGHGQRQGRWRRWAKKHRHEDRIEWLIAALDQPNVRHRECAAHELALETGQDFGAHLVIQSQELCRALQARYREYRQAHR